MSNNVAFARTTTNLGRPGFVVDESMVVRDTGRQIAWEYLDERYEYGKFEVEVTADADIGDTTLAVAALTKALDADTVLDFGLRAAFNVTLGGNEAIGQTDLTVVALPGPVRAGTILKSGAGEFIQVTADAAAGAVLLVVEALEVALENADVLVVPAERMYARLSADSPIGDTSLTVDALDTWINDGSIAYASDGSGGPGKQVPPGTWMCELTNGQIVPRAVRPGSETAKFLLATFADEFSETDAVSGYGVIKSGAIYENLLPEASGSPKVSPAGYVTEALAHGGFWMMEQYADNT